MVDVTDCDREPIHIPGTIQPFGVLFVLAEPSLTITQVSENVGDHLPFRVEEVLGRPLSTMMDPAAADEVREALGEERWHDMNPLSIGAHGRQFDGIVHRHEGAAILELEPNPENPEPAFDSPPVSAALLRIQRVVTSAELAASSFSKCGERPGSSASCSIDSTRTERLRRRRSEGTGARAVSRVALSGLRHPRAGAQAVSRELVAAHLRCQPQASAHCSGPAPRYGNGPLDLSFSVLRSVSPIHLEYMANMGVRASMSISLIVRDRLWGLISCLNHTGPRRVSHQMRIGVRVHRPLDLASDRRVRGPRAARLARLTPSDGGRAGLGDAGGHEDNVLEALGSAQGH